MSQIPEVPWDDDDATVDVARLLMGDDRSSSAVGEFVDRATMFWRNPLNPDTKSYEGLFYERLRGPDEVMMAFGEGAAISTQGVSWDHGLVVSLCIKMFPSFYDAPNGDVPMPDPHEPCVGNHALVLSAFDTTQFRFTFWHLFSPDWGRDGMGTLPLDYLSEKTLGARVFRRHGGPKPPDRFGRPQDGQDQPPDEGTLEPDNLDLAESNKKRLRALRDRYKTEESKWMLDHPNDEVVWMGRALIGSGNGDVWVQSGLILRGVAESSLLIGWMSGRLGRDDLIEIEELFIWPPYRNRGFGAALAGRTLLYAYAFDVRWVKWLELEADAIVNKRVGTVIPRWANGFKWEQANAAAGWGVARVTQEIELLPFLVRLGNLHAPGGVQLLWSDGTVSVADHGTNPSYGLVLEHDVPAPAASEPKRDRPPGGPNETLLQ